MLMKPMQKNFQAFNQRLVYNESGIGEQITERLNNLKEVLQINRTRILIMALMQNMTLMPMRMKVIVSWCLKKNLTQVTGGD